MFQKHQSYYSQYIYAQSKRQHPKNEKGAERIANKPSRAMLLCIPSKLFVIPSNLHLHRKVRQLLLSILNCQTSNGLITFIHWAYRSSCSINAVLFLTYSLFYTGYKRFSRLEYCLRDNPRNNRLTYRLYTQFIELLITTLTLFR